MKNNDQNDSVQTKAEQTSPNWTEFGAMFPDILPGAD